MALRAEAVRVVQVLITAQGQAISADAASGARSRFSAADVIARLVDVQVAASLDAVQVVVHVATGSGDSVGVAQLGSS
jgi:hypothetical protein